MKNLFTIIFFFEAVNVYAQQPNSLAGRIVDSVSLVPVPFATVTLITNHHTSVQKIVSDSTGHYNFTGLPASDYQLQLSAVGYQLYTSSRIKMDDTTKYAGVHFLSSQSDTLTEVTVYASKPLVASSVDGFVYHTANDIISAGTSAADLLQKIPMVTVDQNGNPAVRGSGNILVFIDDKPSAIYSNSVSEALKQISAEDIVKVEVILYPSAKYEAEGADAVINIITRKSRFNAVNGNLRGRMESRTQYLLPSLNIRRGHWILNTDAGINFNKHINGSSLVRNDFSESANNTLEQESERNYTGKIYHAGTNIQYVVSDLQTISAGYRFRVNRNQSFRNTDNAFYRDGNILSEFFQHTDELSTNDVRTFNIGYNGKSIDRKRKLNLLLTYFLHSGFDKYHLDREEGDMVNYRENFRNDISNSEFTLQSDYEQEISKRVTWEMGLRSAFRNSGSKSAYGIYDFPAGTFKDDANRSGHFSYHRNIHAVYTNWNVLLENWQFRAGLRFEQTTLEADIKNTPFDVPGYINLVPSFLISKTFNGKHVFKWNYGKRISRPYFETINPLINQIDSFNTHSGNPDLRPEIIHRYEMGYTFNGRKTFLGGTVFYNTTNNSIQQVKVPLTGGIYHSTYQNIGKNEMVGVSFSLTFKPNQKLSVTSTVNFQYVNIESKVLDQSNSGYQSRGNINLGYEFSKGYSIEAFGQMSSPEILLQGERENWKFYAVTLNKKFKDDRFSVGLRMENLFFPSYQSLDQTWSSPVFRQELTNRYSNRYFWLSFSWKLGKKELKSPGTSHVSEEMGN